MSEIALKHVFDNFAKILEGALLESPDIELIEINQTLFNQGWEYFQKQGTVEACNK